MPHVKVAAGRSRSAGSLIVTVFGLPSTFDFEGLCDEFFEYCQKVADKATEDVVPHAARKNNLFFLFCSLKVARALCRKLYSTKVVTLSLRPFVLD